jgi:hypothetical protein
VDIQYPEDKVLRLHSLSLLKRLRIQAKYSILQHLYRLCFLDFTNDDWRISFYEKINCPGLGDMRYIPEFL